MCRMHIRLMDTIIFLRILEGSGGGCRSQRAQRGNRDAVGQVGNNRPLLGVSCIWHHYKLSVVLSEDDWGVVDDEIRVDRNGAKKDKALCRAQTIPRVL
jgi:hypothetical protein